MRRLISVIVVPVAIVGLAITASAADAKGFKTKAFLEEIGSVGGGDTFVFSGRVESRSDKCLGNRKVSIHVAPVRVGARGSFAGAVVKGRTTENGRFELDSGLVVILAAPYEARVKQRKRKKGLTCKSAISDPLNPISG